MPYDYKLHHRFHENDGTLIRTDLFRFVTAYNRVYFAEVEVYEDNLYAIKFYCRKHRHLKNRYNLMLNDHDAFNILRTILCIAKDIEEKDDFASFCFFGAPKEGEGFCNTQRYRIYEKIAYRDFSPDKYNHVKDDSNSIFFILNNENTNIDMQTINQRINEYYILPSQA